MRQYLSVRTTDADNQSAIALLDSAIARDPGFARAHAELASAYVTRLAYVAPDETRELEEKAFAAAERALSIDPNVPEATRAAATSVDSLTSLRARACGPGIPPRAGTQSEIGSNAQTARPSVRACRVLRDARHHADVALTINPSNAQALNSRAQALCGRGWTRKRSRSSSAFLDQFCRNWSKPTPSSHCIAWDVAMKHGRIRGGRWRNSRTDPSGNLPGIEALLLAESEPRHAQELIDSVRREKRPTLLIMLRIWRRQRWRGWGEPGRPLALLQEAASTGFPLLFVVRAGPEPRSDPARSTFPGIHGGDAEVVRPLRRALLADSQ